MRRTLDRIVWALALEQFVPAFQARACEASAVLTYQGKDWTSDRRLASRDQGTRIMPLAWFKAHRRADGSAFLPDGLRLYGYLDNPASAHGIPVGLTVESSAPTRSIGMTCAACHTRDF